MPHKYLIDVHVHLNNYHESSRRPTAENAEDLFAKMDDVGVDHAVVITSYKADLDRPSVEELLTVLTNHPRITLVEGLRWRGESRTDLFSLEERLRDGLIKGIKLYPGYDNYAINDASLESVVRIAAKYQVPVMIHTGDTYSKTAKVRMAHPLLVDDVAVDYPDVKFVMCHLGNPWFQDAAEVLYKNENVYADISGLVLGEFTYEFERYVAMRLKDMITYMGDPGKQLMYGTDWPLVRMRPYLKLLEELDLDDEQLENVAWRTAAKLFRIDEQVLANGRVRDPGRGERTERAVPPPDEPTT
jgi:predicted TIM-barrel fold metal-dependent hydrolase